MMMSNPQKKKYIYIYIMYLNYISHSNTKQAKKNKTNKQKHKYKFFLVYNNLSHVYIYRLSQQIVQNIYIFYTTHY